MILTKDKVDFLRRRLHSLESAVVAFSGGVDSALLTVLAFHELGDKMIAVTAVSPSFPSSDRTLAESFCRSRNIPHVFVETDEFSDPVFINNPDNRCYYCKKYLYKAIVDIADKLNFKHIIEGTNAADLSGHRPGFTASKENPRVVTPLVDASFTKDDVRSLAAELKLEVAEKPSAACLASRFPTGTLLTKTLMEQVDAAEDMIRSMGVSQVRVRYHGELARVEVQEGDLEKCIGMRNPITDGLKKLGWKFVCLDLMGYRTGGARG